MRILTAPPPEGTKESRDSFQEVSRQTWSPLNPLSLSSLQDVFHPSYPLLLIAPRIRLFVLAYSWQGVFYSDSRLAAIATSSARHLLSWKSPRRSPENDREAKSPILPGSAQISGPGQSSFPYCYPLGNRNNEPVVSRDWASRVRHYESALAEVNLQV